MVRSHAIGITGSDTKGAHEQLCSSEERLGKSATSLLPEKPR